MIAIIINFIIFSYLIKIFNLIKIQLKLKLRLKLEKYFVIKNT